MIEIRLDNELIGYYDELREALLQVIDSLAVDETATLAKIYKKYRNWSDEDLIEEIQEEQTALFNQLGDLTDD